MTPVWKIGIAFIALLLPTLAGAQEATTSHTETAHYIAVMSGTTLAYRPHAGSLEGPQKDLSPTIGYGRFITERVALELDVALTFSKGTYVSTALVPGAVWAFSDYFYAAGRLIVPIDPGLNLGLCPGAGAIYFFESGIAPFLEMNAISFVGRGEPDFAVGMTLGLLYNL